MAKTIYVVHGFDSSPHKNWFEWLEKELTVHGVVVRRLAMPNPTNPQLKEWLDALSLEIIPHEDVYIVAHSLGCIAVLRYIERLNFDTKLGGVVLVSGFDKPLEVLPILNPFVQSPLDTKKIIEIVKKRIVISAKDDEIVPTELSRDLAVRIEAEFVQTETGNHFMDSDGFVELPIVLESLQKGFN